MRNLTKTLVAVSLLTSTSVHSLGIGGIKLRSALNQKLNAEIALVTSGSENVGDIQVKLASPAKFDEAGVPWSYFLTKIKFTPMTKADGSVGVKLSSNEVLKEPYLDFLVEVTGPSGTLFREFTVLVDPPKMEATKKRDIPVVAYDVPHSQPIAVDDFEEAGHPVESVINDGENFGSDHASGEYDREAREYGPTQEDDTIWSIANQVKPDHISTAQMVAALQRANPRAFSRSDASSLLAGKILRIPANNTIVKSARHQAAVNFKQPKQRRVAQFTKAIKPIKRLQLNPPVTETADPIINEVANGKVANEHTQNRAPVDTAGDADLKLRFEKIEQQLQMMEKLLSVKDAELAKLQKQSSVVEAKPENVAPVIEPVKTEPVIEAPLVGSKPVAEAVSEIKPVVTAPTVVPEVVEPKAVTPEPVVIAPPAVPQPTSEGTLNNPLADYLVPAGGIGASLLAAFGLIWWRKRKVEKTMDTDSMFASASQISMPDKDKSLSALAEQTSGYEVGTVGDSTFLSEFTPSEFDAFETDQTEIDPLSEADVYLAYGRYQQAEELIKQVIDANPNRNDCKLKLLEIYQTSENKGAFDLYVDTLNAEGKQADTVFWAKVIEMTGEFKTIPPTISTMTLNKAKSATEVPKFESPSDEFDFDLKSFADMPIATDAVLKVDKNSVKPIVASVASASSIFNDTPEYPDLINDKAISDLDFDLKQYETDSFSAIQMNEYLTQSNGIQSVDFDLSAFSSPEVADENEIEFIAEGDGNSLDFDLSLFGDSLNTTESIELLDDTKDANAIEFGLSTFGGSLPNVEPVKSEGLMAGLDFEFEDDNANQNINFDLSDELDESLRDLDFSTIGLQPKSATEANEVVDDNSDFDFDFDFDLDSVDAPSKSGKAVDKLDLDNADNSYDRIDLANAYVDMGDVDAAKDIANDLLKGSAEQKKAAKQILEKIS